MGPFLIPSSSPLFMLPTLEIATEALLPIMPIYLALLACFFRHYHFSHTYPGITARMICQ